MDVLADSCMYDQKTLVSLAINHRQGLSAASLLFKICMSPKMPSIPSAASVTYLGSNASLSIKVARYLVDIIIILRILVGCNCLC